MKKCMIFTVMLAAAVSISAAPKKQTFERSSTGPEYSTTEVGFGRGTTRYTPGQAPTRQAREEYVRSSSSRSNSGESNTPKSTSSDGAVQANVTVVTDQELQASAGQVNAESQYDEKTVSDSSVQTEQTSEIESVNQKANQRLIESSDNSDINLGLFPEVSSTASTNTRAQSFDPEHSDREYTDEDFNEPTIWQILRKKFSKPKNVISVETPVNTVDQPVVVESAKLSVPDVAEQPKVPVSVMPEQRTVNPYGVGLGVILVVGVMYWAYKKGYFSF